jgi:hypothetical protein
MQAAWKQAQAATWLQQTSPSDGCNICSWCYPPRSIPRCCKYTNAVPDAVAVHALAHQVCWHACCAVLCCLQEIDRRKQEQAEAAAFIAAASRPPPGSEHQLEQQQQQPSSKQDDEDADAEFAYQGPVGGLGSSSSNAATAAAAAAGLGSSSSAPSDADMDEYERERQRRLKMSGEDAFAARGRLGGCVLCCY